MRKSEKNNMKWFAKFMPTKFVMGLLCLFFGITAQAQDSASLFAGCDDRQRAPTVGADADASPRERIDKPKVDKITKRSFASLSMSDIEGGVPENMSNLCWARLDGVWRAETSPTLDRSKDDNTVWGSDTPQLISLANGNYTKPDYLVVQDGGNPEQELLVTTGLHSNRSIRFVSSDGLSLADVMKRNGPIKTFVAEERFAYGQRLTLDVTRSGRVRLNFSRTSFVRPLPGVSKATMSGQLPADDAFLLSYNLDNLAASRRGYDPVTQDPFYLLQNDKMEVFARVDPRNYYITEKRTVPLGFSLVQEQAQGYVFRKKLVTSETEVQETLAHSYGASVSLGKPEKASVNVGFDATSSTTNSLTQSKSVAQAIGYSRAKKYALVVDHPYVTLSEEFIDAVEDARRHHRYQRLIDKFGSHYAYAVTYGAMARMTQSLTSDQYVERAQKSASFSATAGATLYGSSGDVRGSTSSGSMSGTSGSVGNEGMTFVGVGGNGSWDQNGFSAGDTPVPILLDLRQMSELLNPMNFPDEPEIYGRVRSNLERAITHHMSRNRGVLSNASWLPPVPDPEKDKPVAPKEERWYAYVRNAWCQGGPVVAAKTKAVSGTVTISAKGFAKVKKVKVGAKCKVKKESKTYDYSSGDRGLLIFSGTREEIAKQTIYFDYEYQMLPYKKTHKVEKRFPSGALKKGLGVNKSKSYVWKIERKGLSTVYLNLRLKRKK